MIIRIVKMSFQKDKVSQFIENFNNSKDEIMNFEGCNLLDLLQVKDKKNVYMTYSYWDDEASLDTYRNSELFKSVWGPTKLMFDEKPEAWTMERVLGVHKL